MQNRADCSNPVNLAVAGVPLIIAIARGRDANLGDGDEGPETVASPISQTDLEKLDGRADIDDDGSGR